MNESLMMHPSVYDMYEKLYKGQIFSFKTSLAVKWFAFKSIKAIKKIRKGAGNES